MKNVLAYLVSHLVDHPDDIEIEEDAASDRTLLTLHVHPDDMGKVIGKSGRIIRGLRDLIKLMAAKRDTFADVVLAEENPTPSGLRASNPDQ